MTVEFRRICPEDFDNIELQDGDPVGPKCLSRMKTFYYVTYKKYAATAYCTETGRILCIGGIHPDGTAWTLLAKDLKREMVPILRFVRQMMRQYSLTRGPVYATIDETRAVSVKWATLLGFERYKRSLWRYTH